MSKTVLITGSSSGIGKETAKLFQLCGWNVAASVLRVEEAGDLPELENVICPQLDVTDESSIHRAVQETVDRFGDIDVLVNNAGYALVGPFEHAEDEQIRRQFETNVFGLMNMTKAVLPRFRERRRGTIVNIASIGGRMAFPLYSSYHATKWAVDGFSESLQHELKPFGIRVRIIEPGPIKTDFYGDSMDTAQAAGTTEYGEYVEKATNNMLNSGRSGASPAKVARVILKAALSKSWKLRYGTDRYGRFILTCRRLMPDSLYNAIIRAVVLR